MNTKQPKWRYIANLGDYDPLAGSFMIFRDTTGVYGYEAEVCESTLQEDNREVFFIYRFELERYRWVEEIDEKEGTLRYLRYLVPVAYCPEWPHAAIKYEPWWFKDLQSISDSAGYAVSELLNRATSDNPIKLGHFYQSLLWYFGPEEFNYYPRKLTYGQVNKRYRHIVKSKTYKQQYLRG